MTDRQEQIVSDEMNDIRLTSDYEYFKAFFEIHFFNYEEAKKNLKKLHKKFGWEFEE